MSLSKEQWATVEKALSGSFGQVRLLCDGHEISAQIERYKGLRSVVDIYIDGWIKGEWMKESNELARKFWRLRKCYLHSAAKRAEFAQKAKRRGFSAQFRQWLKDAAEAHVISVEPCWPNAKDFCRHLRKTCQSIELVEVV